MFTQQWFWISFFAFYFVGTFQYYRTKGLLNGTKVLIQETVANLCSLALLIFWAIGLFVADSWWQPIVALGISVFVSGILGGVVDAILPKSARIFVAALSPLVALALTVAAYIVWY